MKTIVDDPEAFFADGGWNFLGGDSDVRENNLPFFSIRPLPFQGEGEEDADSDESDEFKPTSDSEEAESDESDEEEEEPTSESGKKTLNGVIYPLFRLGRHYGERRRERKGLERPRTRCEKRLAAFHYSRLHHLFVCCS